MTKVAHVDMLAAVRWIDDDVKDYTYVHVTAHAQSTIRTQLAQYTIN